MFEDFHILLFTALQQT